MNSLTEPYGLRGLHLRNRIVLSPLCQYSATDGMADDWHLVQLGRFAVGGFGVVFTEATAVLPEGRITHGDLGLWSREQMAPLARIARFLRAQGAAPAIQLAHAGRKAAMQRPWFGNGPLGAADVARGDRPWSVVGPSALPVDAGWLLPKALDEAGMLRIGDAFADAASRAMDAGFEVVEVHAAHGYLLHQFLSPLSNRRTDAWGGDAAGRRRLPLEIVERVRAVWPQDRPVFVRVSAMDAIDGGLTIEDQIGFAVELRERGVDVVDCSSGGISGTATASTTGPKRDFGFQVPFAARMRREARLATMAVGLIVGARQAQAILDREEADLIAIGREALEDPNWAWHAAPGSGLAGYAGWPEQHGWWLANRADLLDQLGRRPE